MAKVGPGFRKKRAFILELGSTNRNYSAWRMETRFEGCAMSSETAKEFEKYARDCVKLAKDASVSPELRNQLLEMAREWMHAIIAEEDGSQTPAPK